MKYVQASLSARNDRQSSFHHCGVFLEAPASLLSLRNDVELSFHHGGGPVMLVQACLNAGKVRKGCFMKYMQACLSARNYR